MEKQIFEDETKPPIDSEVIKRLIKCNRQNLERS